MNSKFTAQIFRDTFTSLSHIEPVVLYPSLNFDAFKKEIPSEVRERILKDQIPNGRSYFFLSINRYERKKNLALALNALKAMKDECTSSEWEKVQLIMAGQCNSSCLLFHNHTMYNESLNFLCCLEQH